MTSNTPVVKSVAKKLKYYFEVKRLEDGFDLSDINAPVLDHPPLKSRPTLQYDGLHDRPLKHYFKQPEVRVHLTQMGVPDARLRNPRERHIKKTLTRNMKKHHFLKPTIPEFYYVYSRSGPKVHPSMVGFGASPTSQRKKALKGGWPVMRSVPPVNISRGEAERLVNSATKLIAATETLEHMSAKSQQSPESKRRLQSAPRSFERPGSRSGKRRPLTAKYSWDLHGHRVPTAKVKAYDDTYLDKMPRQGYSQRRRSPSPSSSSSSSTEESSLPPHRPSPPPHKPRSPPSPTLESGTLARHQERTVINLPPEKIRDQVTASRPTPPKYEMSCQTDRHLLEEYDQDEEEVKEGAWGEYQIYVQTADRIGASTSADVFLTIYGDKGRTPPIKLAASKRNKVKFQRGKEDLFLEAAHHVGKMKKIKIGHDRSQLNYAWYLESVTVYDMNDKKIYDFPCNRWLSGQDDDHRTYRVLPVDRVRSFVDALEKTDERPGSRSSKPRRSKHSDSDSSTERGGKSSSSQHKAGSSMRAKRSQRSGDSSTSHSSSSSSSSSSGDEAVVKMAAPASPKKGEPRHPASKEKDAFFDQDPPGTVFQFKKKGSQAVEEEEVLREGGKAGGEPPRDQGDKEAGEAAERKRQEDERLRERMMLTGPSIHDACRSGNLQAVKTLLDKFPEMKDFRDESGWTPLHLAAANGHADVIKWLTSTAHDDINLPTPTGFTPVHVAASNGHLDTLMVLQAMGADVSCKTSDKQTPLHLASKAGHLEMVKWLVANGSALEAQDSAGRMAQELAQEHGHHAVQDFLRVCQRDLADPNSTFAQMHRAQHRGQASVGLPTIKEDDKGSSGSEPVRIGKPSRSADHYATAQHDR